MTRPPTSLRTSKGGEFGIDIAFQPIFDSRTREPRAYEALVRGKNGEGAASILSSVRDGEWDGFEQLAQVLAIEKAAALGILRTKAALSINFDPTRLTDIEACLAHTIAAADRVGLERRRIVFEFTEGTRLDVDLARDIVDAYARHGFRTALDDFGDGYAGLVTLADVATDFVKLDIGLIRGIDASYERQTIVASMTEMLAALGRRVVAEGIETSAELQVVRALGIEMVQGYYLGRPSRTELQRQPYGVARAA